MNCVIHSLFWKNKFQFRISASVIEDENKADLALDGTFEPAPAEKPISESAVQASLRLKGTNLKHYASYLKSRRPSNNWKDPWIGKQHFQEPLPILHPGETLP